ncbi:Gfo/Idh/MocA family oxidoreductase [Paenibacillus filicis]|uniref:Gfo/Idh/MocA family oxidoreductase n=1 Tax=Paenibacillus gyeongsangnamensis TaxID=3388067 RepID=A0ABT4QID4_9BACL|nr:Gfo/Idh/MocA family oxidoreductase [Paenibacillus filicis]MCZ8516642.1 Gfo/Idh/MocA family oxidoreductase [Paenibacillus filicis]
MKTIRFGIIGCGDVTEVKSGPGFQKAAHSSLVAVMRRNGKLAEDYARRHGVPRWYADAQALIDDPEVDAVYVATPPGSHLEYTLAAAKAGKPVYVEKPMALNGDECDRMVAACREAKVPLFVAYYRRALPRFLKVKELLEAGAIGDVRFVQTVQYQPAPLIEGGSVPWRLQPELSGGGLFFDLASHTLDILDFLLGPVAEAKGLASNQMGQVAGVEDIVTGTYKFASGVYGTGTWCFSAFGREDRNEMIGSKGKLVFSTFGHEPVVLETADGATTFPFERPDHIQQPLIQTIVNDLLGIGKCASTGETAARTSRVMDALVKGWQDRS